MQQQQDAAAAGCSSSRMQQQQDAAAAQCSSSTMQQQHNTAAARYSSSVQIYIRDMPNLNFTSETKHLDTL
jgi:hypothetical protein